MLKEARIVTVQALSVNLGEAVLSQDEELLILEVRNNQVTFVRMTDNKQYTTSQSALEMVVE